jgi:hypothetical protein
MVEFWSSLLLFFLWLSFQTAGALWTYGSALVVLLGVVGESIADLTEWVKSERLKKKLAVASALILILGLTGDLIGIRETELSIASLTIAAGDAKTSADKAAAAASRASSAAAQAEGYAAKANEKADRFRLQIAQANERAAEAKQAAEAERLARVKIQQQLSWRSLSAAQRERIRNRILPFAGQQFDLV